MIRKRESDDGAETEAAAEVEAEAETEAEAEAEAESADRAKRWSDERAEHWHGASSSSATQDRADEE
ncbi:hypothetical protein [Agromyces kandeliae]|uniref:Uncharacterized protein n=1 Tax=Agromyces kandeliae TaxID=2666141 RepID=A0A6L5R3J5_9MICO|nr:hypothetical protein [Agromyces kandeliae]MRX44522.1 hypothetical protein [Agromyces kandeliae]